MITVLRSPNFWFCIALFALIPLQLWFVVSSPWIDQPPKPIGDGPDYENIAYQLSIGNGWSVDWSDPDWQAPYQKASLSGLDPDAAQALPPDRIPIADYSVQLNQPGPRIPTTARPPMLPLLIATIYQLFERGPIAFATVRIVLALCLAIGSSMAVAMAAYLMTRITDKTLPIAVAALITLMLAAMDRTIRTYATDFLTEPVALLLTQLLVWNIWRLLVDNKPSTTKTVTWAHDRNIVIVSGCLLAALIYTRSIIVMWIPGIWLLMLLPARWFSTTNSTPEPSAPVALDPVWRSAHRATMIMFVCLLALAPWWLRNCVVLRAVLPLGTQGPITLLGGYHDSAIEHRGEWTFGPELQLRAELADPAMPRTAESVVAHEVTIARAASHRVATWIRRNIAQLPRLAVLRVKTEWGPYSGRALLWKLAAAWGLCFLVMRLRPAALILGGLLLISTLTVAVLYSVGGRFLVPTYGVLYTLAGIGVASLTNATWWKRR